MTDWDRAEAYEKAHKRVLNVLFALGYGYRATDELVGEIAVELMVAGSRSFGCLNDRTGSGVFIWVKSRLLERGFFDFGWNQEPDDRVRAGLFHFNPWDVEKYGEWNDNPQLLTLIEEMAAGVQRSPLDRLIDAKPVNRTTHKVASEKKVTQCSKCGKHFKSEARVAKHLEGCKGRQKPRRKKSE